MVILNGVDNMAEFTFQVRKRQSTVDLLIVDDRIFQQGGCRDEGDSDSEVEDSVEGVEGIHYVRGSVKVWQEELVRIGDHKLVTGKLQVGPWRADRFPVHKWSRGRRVLGGGGEMVATASFGADWWRKVM